MQKTRFKTKPRPEKKAKNSIKWKFWIIANSQYCLMLNEINCKPKKR